MTTDAPATATSSKPTDVAPELLEQWLRSGDAVLIDVREDFEHAAERIPQAEHVPLKTLDPDALRARHPDKRVVFHCRTGKRSAEAARRFARADEPAFHLTGGIEAWKAADRPVERSAAAPRIDVMRQVQIVAGSLVVLGVTLGVLASPWFLALGAFVGCGLVFAGLTGWCGMAKLLARMPWNRASA